MAAGGSSKSYRNINNMSKDLLGKRVVKLSNYHAFLQKLGRNLCSDNQLTETLNWERLAEELGLCTYEVENIHRYASFQKIYPGSVLIRQWGESEGSTVYVLLKALRKIGREDCVEEVCQALEDENTMELHYSIEYDSGVKEFSTVKTKTNASLGSSLENILKGLVCYSIIGPDSTVTWQTVAGTLKGKQLSLKKIPFDIKHQNSLYGHIFNNRCQFPNELTFIGKDVKMYSRFPTNIPITQESHSSFTTDENAVVKTQSTTSKYCDESACPNVIQPKESQTIEQTESNQTFKHCKSFEETNFHSLTEVKRYEKTIPVVTASEETCLKKCHAKLDVYNDSVKHLDICYSCEMNTSGCFTGCRNFHCGAENCTHSLVWQDGQLQYSNLPQEELNISKDSIMDTRDSLEIYTSGQFTQEETDYIPHTSVFSRRKSIANISPLNSPCKDETEKSICFNMTSPAQKGGENNSDSLLRTALRRSFEKKASEKSDFPTPKPCKRFTLQSQNKETDFDSVQLDSGTVDLESHVSTVEEELSKRPPHCRLPVSADVNIDMDSSDSESGVRPNSLPLESSMTYINMSGTGAFSLARRPLPPRPRDIHECSVSNIFHSCSMGDMIMLNHDDEYNYINNDDQTQISTCESMASNVQVKKRLQNQQKPLVKSHSMTAIQDLASVPGWCSSINEENVSATMSKYKNDDGNFMVWRMKNGTFVITVS
ncbi:uncharacterized protein LOC126828356 isoform X2 [Patella vulgata]|nr:uncharacterized protein LOC126828356 isoform X2 [Patella vulgata]